MTFDKEKRIINENYADILIEYNEDDSIFDKFQDATVNFINSIYATVHIPSESLNMNLMTEWGYSAIPKCLGMISENSNEASGIPKLRSVPNFNLRGQGVLLGIIDTGIDYTNSIFKNSDGTTRVFSIWDQTIQDSENSKILYGTEYTREDINRALVNENPLSVVPSMDSNGHGTMVAGIAAGNEVPEKGFYGVATDAELVIVKLKPAKKVLKNFFAIPENVECYSETDILFGINYLLQISNEARKPMIICLALGTSQSGHDGRGILSNTLSLVGISNGIAIVTAAGNEGNDRRHYFGKVDEKTGFDTVELNVGADESGFSLELWGEAQNIYSIEITTPSGETVTQKATYLNESQEIRFVFDKTVIHYFYELIEKQSGDPMIFMRFENPSQGVWKFKVLIKGNLNLGFHMWLPMGNFISQNTYFIKSDIYTTILTPGNATIPITVTAYNFKDESLYQNASRGYTRKNVIKPEIAAPGVNVTGPTLKGGFAEYTGTSAAAAHAAGVSAMLMEWGYLRGIIPRMSTIQLKRMMVRGARRSENLTYPNQDWGYGILDAYKIIDVIRTRV